MAIDSCPACAARMEQNSRPTMPEGQKSGPTSKSRILARIAITGVEKRYKPDKHYVFILQVKWTDKTDYVIYRNYNHFFEFHMNLMEVFPLESGAINPEERIIPFLPGRRLFRRNEVQKIATRRQMGLAEYCIKLLDLPDKIKNSSHILDFFTATQEDISPPKDATKPKTGGILRTLLPFFYSKDDPTSPDKDPADLMISEPLALESYIAVADYKAAEKREISFNTGQQVDILEKNENGWWFVQIEDKQGWAPASYLDPLNQGEELDEPEPCLSGEKFITTDKYDAQFDDEISVEAGVIVYVMHKLLDGWWIVSYQDNTGYLPAAYLAPYSNKHLRQITVRRQTFKPIPRRRTLNKVSTSVKRNQRDRDLTIYGRASLKFKNRPNRPEQDDASAIYEDDEDSAPDYENTETLLAELARTEMGDGVCHSLEEGEFAVYYDETAPTAHSTLGALREEAEDDEEGEDYINVPDTKRFGARTLSSNQQVDYSDSDTDGYEEVEDPADYINCMPMANHHHPSSPHSSNPIFPKRSEESSKTLPQAQFHYIKNQQQSQQQQWQQQQQQQQQGRKWHTAEGIKSPSPNAFLAELKMSQAKNSSATTKPTAAPRPGARTLEPPDSGYIKMNDKSNTWQTPTKPTPFGNASQHLALSNIGHNQTGLNNNNNVFKKKPATTPKPNVARAPRPGQGPSPKPAPATAPKPNQTARPKAPPRQNSNSSLLSDTTSPNGNQSDQSQVLKKPCALASKIQRFEVR